MPRPTFKRRRSNSHSPGRSKRVPPNAGLENSYRAKLQQQLANKSIGQRPQDSDDSDRLVTRTRHGRSRRSPEQIFASGGVAKGDKPGVFPTKQERTHRLRSETDEIISRSRSKSTEASNELPSISRRNNSDNKTVPTPNAPASRAKSPQSVLLRAHPTPVGERSVLGSLKPRRRQASILHMVGNNDSSIINPEDEEQFLPDDESTPLNLRKPEKQTPRSPTITFGSASRKRKFGLEEPGENINGVIPISTVTQTQETQRISETPIPTPPKRRTSRKVDEDEIMALPQSSSPETSPQKPKSTVPNKSKKSSTALTTEQLQSLMPSKRRQGARQRKQRTEFDIPSDPTSDDLEDESIFQPKKRIDKSRSTGKKVPAISKANTKATGKAQKATTAIGTPMAAKSKPSKSTSSPTTVVAPRTPLPLTRNANQENKTMSLARNRRSKPNGDKENTATAYEKQSGGSRPRRALRSAITNDAENDKENVDSGPTPARSLRKRTTASKPTFTVDIPLPSVENNNPPTVDDMDIDAELTNDNSSDTRDDIVTVDVLATASPTSKKPIGTEAKAWKNKWAGIDDWSLDYEEVSISTGSSSPLVRASVV